MKDAVKLNEIKTEVKSLRLPDADHVHKIGQLAYRMGIPVTQAAAQKIPSMRVVWERGWRFEEQAFSNLLKRNGGRLA